MDTNRYIYLYLLDRRYLTGQSKHVGSGTGRVSVSHGGRKSYLSPSGQQVYPNGHGSCWPVGKVQVRKLSRLLGSMYRNLQTFCSNRKIYIHHRYNCCSHRYDHQSQLEMLSYRTEWIVVISIRTDRNILLFVANRLLCFKGNKLKYFSRILIEDT